MKKILQIIFLYISSCLAPAKTAAQLLIADYPLTTNSNDQTGNFTPVIYGLNGTPPPTAACANGIYTNDLSESINNGFGTFSTPTLNSLFNKDNFQIDLDFKSNSFPLTLTPMPIITLGPLYRTIGICVSSTGALTIIYNNAVYIPSGFIMATEQFYSVSLKYKAPEITLYVNGGAVLVGALPPLEFSPSGDDIKLYAANGSNGQAFNGCLKNLKVYSCSTVSPTISINASSTEICNGEQIIFSATSTNAGTQPLYEWKVNGVSAGNSNAVFSPPSLNNNDQVTCTLTSNEICASSSTVTSNIITISVKPKLIINRDTNLCPNASLQLQSVDALSYQWSPSQGLNNTGIQNPVFSAGLSNSSNTYFLTTTNYSGNLVLNPDFEEGNTNFITNYTNCTTNNCLFPLADNGYSVGSDANFFHALFQGKDHTTGNGNFMIINGAQPNLVVWKQVIAVTPNTDYAFGTWISTLIAQNTASIRFSINGVQLGDIFAAPAAPNEWVRYFTTWNSGSNTSATIEVVDVFPEASGNDFGLDDIFFGKITSCTDSIKISVNESYNGLPDTITICAGSTILDAGSGFNTYQWSTGATTQTITVSQAGLYKVKVINISCSFSDSVFVKLQPVNAVSTKDTICAGQSYNLPSGKKVTATGIYRDTLANREGCDSVIITTDLFVFSPSVNNINRTLCSGESYVLPSGTSADTSGIFKDTVRTAFGCDSVITNLTLTVIEPVIKEVNAFICNGQSFTLPSGVEVSTAGNYADTARSISGCDSIISITKVTIGNNSLSAAAATLCIGQTYALPSGKIVSMPGIYKDTLRNSAGCDSIITTTITYKPSLTVSLNDPEAVCSGDPVNLAANASGGNNGPYIYTWSVSNSNSSQITITPSVTTTVMVSVSDGCTLLPATDTVTVIVNQKPVPGFTVNNNGGCTPLAVVFTNTTQPVSGNTYKWDLGNGTISSFDSPSAVYSDPGSYGVSLLVTNSNGCSDSVKIANAVSVNNKPEAAFSISPSPNISGNLKFQFTDMSIGSNTWLWDFGDNNGKSSQQNPLYNYKNTGTYTVSLITNSGANCSDTAFHEIEINGYNGIFIPTAFSPNGDGKNDQFRVFGTGIQSAEMQVLNRWGEIVCKTTDNPPVWDGRNNKNQTVCMPGNYIYLIKIIDRNGASKVYKGNILLVK